MKKTIAALKNKDFQKLLVGSVIMLAGVAIMAKSNSTIDKKYGAETIIRTAEKMQPGFREALKEFIKTEYAPN